MHICFPIENILMRNSNTHAVLLHKMILLFQVEGNRSLTAEELAQEIGLSVILSKER
jgi:hypothetical protein